MKQDIEEIKNLEPVKDKYQKRIIPRILTVSLLNYCV